MSKTSTLNDTFYFAVAAARRHLSRLPKDDARRELCVQPPADQPHNWFGFDCSVRALAAVVLVLECNCGTATRRKLELVRAIRLRLVQHEDCATYRPDATMQIAIDVMKTSGTRKDRERATSWARDRSI